MRIIASCFSVLLSLAGCHDRPQATTVVRASADGVDTLHSRATLRGGVARFECLRSDSGHCHYVVQADDCRLAAGVDRITRCGEPKVERFALDVGANVELAVRTTDLRQCVDSLAPAAPDCPG
ncbi:hypothetical protein [Pseudoxanthomonas mexicana]|uniref:hypothetical protein n=1 Tax=Pseudoxanthomonas mexicana TaxID=128785 RepID=UPI00398A9FAC